MITTRSSLVCLFLAASLVAACSTTILPATDQAQSADQTGNGGGIDGEPEPQVCHSSADCAAHQTCLEGGCVDTCGPHDIACRTGCTHDVDCASGHCDDGVCAGDDAHCSEYCDVIEDTYGQHGLGNAPSASQCLDDCKYLVPNQEKECVLGATNWHKVEDCGRDGFEDLPHDRWHSEDPVDNCLACQEWASNGACMIAALNYQNDQGALDFLACEEACNFTEECVSSCRTQHEADVWRVDEYWDCSVCILCQEACAGTDVKGNGCKP